jgi:hypothetical protein
MGRTAQAENTECRRLVVSQNLFGLLVLGIWILFVICYLPARHLSGGVLGIFNIRRRNYI